MIRLALLLVTAATVVTLSAAEARDGCGRGWFYNGRACVQMDDDEPQYAPRPRQYGDYGYDGPRYYRPEPRYYGPPRPVVGRNGAISCMNPGYTWQDGACKPYRGP